MTLAFISILLYLVLRAVERLDLRLLFSSFNGILIRICED